MKTSTRPTGRLLNNLGALAGQRTEFKKTEGRTSCLLSVLLRITQIIQELLLQKCYTDIKPNSLFGTSQILDTDRPVSLTNKAGSVTVMPFS